MFVQRVSHEERSIGMMGGGQNVSLDREIDGQNILVAHGLTCQVAETYRKKTFIERIEEDIEQVLILRGELGAQAAAVAAPALGRSGSLIVSLWAKNLAIVELLVVRGGLPGILALMVACGCATPGPLGDKLGNACVVLGVVWGLLLVRKVLFADYSNPEYDRFRVNVLQKHEVIRHISASYIETGVALHGTGVSRTKLTTGKPFRAIPENNYVNGGIPDGGEGLWGRGGGSRSDYKEGLRSALEGGCVGARLGGPAGLMIGTVAGGLFFKRRPDEEEEK